MTATTCTWYGWRCRRALRRNRRHRHTMPATDAALRCLLEHAARHRGRWLVLEAADGSAFGQCVAVGGGLLGVELSDPVNKTIWPLHAVPVAARAVVVRLRGAYRRRFAPLWFPARALYLAVDAAALIGQHLDGRRLPLRFDACPVDIRWSVHCS